MRARQAAAVLLLMVVPLWLAGQQPADHHHHDEAEHDQHVEHGVMESMSSADHHQGPHFHWTAVRPRTPEDEKQAEEILQTLRQALEPYKDYRVALADGYKPFLPNLQLPEYHFTHYGRAFMSAFRFDPAQPSSLLYKKTADGYELVGAMYTASRYAEEDDLDQRIPLGIARWHAHVNICLPPRGQGATADWKKFGPRGSIATESACREAGGRWHDQLFGWMVHVYPFEDTPEKIWTHR